MKKILGFMLVLVSLSAMATKEIKAVKKAQEKKMKTEIATLAGGCFWGMEEILRTVPGILKTEVGYTGGEVANPTYSIVKLGKTNHAESIQIEFDPTQISYESLLRDWFFRMHNPTQVNAQGNDVGTQYRSVIFYHSDEQRRVAEKVKVDIDTNGVKTKSGKLEKLDKPVATQIVAATKFYPAEDYHQDYLQKNPDGYTCHFIR